jgi:hypothetical protein
MYCLASFNPILSIRIDNTGFPLNDIGSGSKLPLSENISDFDRNMKTLIINKDKFSQK